MTESPFLTHLKALLIMAWRFVQPSVTPLWVCVSFVRGSIMRQPHFFDEINYESCAFLTLWLCCDSVAGMFVTFLGTGTSFGVPRLGCSCKVCTSPDPRDFRNRSSVFIIGDGGERILIDVSPEFRFQALKAHITGIDAVFITHVHADHVHGLDDVRPFTREKPLPLFIAKSEHAELLQKFDYVFNFQQPSGGLPKLDLKIIDQTITVGTVVVTPLHVMHGNRPILGFRLNNFVYITDCSFIPQETLKLCADANVVVLDGLRHRPHPTHFTITQALETARQMQPERCYLTHLCHDLLHTEIEAFCADYVASKGLSFFAGPAYDSLTITC